MSDFVRLNGLETCVSEGNWEVQPVGQQARRSRGLNDKLTVTNTSCKNIYRGSTVILSANDACPLAELISQKGWSWDFNDHVYGGKGIGPDSGDIFTQAGTGGKHNGYIQVPSGNTVGFTLGTALSSPWTILVWSDNGTSGASFDHYALDSNDDAYKNGAITGIAVEDFFAVNFAGSVATVEIKGEDETGSSAIVRYSEMFVIPEILTPQQVLDFYTLNNTTQFPQLPELLLTGDAVKSNRTVIGQLDRAGPYRDVVTPSGIEQYFPLDFLLEDV